MLMLIKKYCNALVTSFVENLPDFSMYVHDCCKIIYPFFIIYQEWPNLLYV